MNKTIQILSISTALIGAGGIATLSLFDIPELQSQPASRSLPSIRWLFSRGSHIFPTASVLSSAGFIYTAYAAIPQSARTLSHITSLSFGNRSIVLGYVLAGVLAFSIGPFTKLMIPTNFRLIELNEKYGGYRSADSAEQNRDKEAGQSAKDSVDGKGEIGQFKDLSRPQERTREEPGPEVDGEVKDLLGSFGRLNMGRAILLGAGGLVGLATALM